VDSSGLVICGGVELKPAEFRLETVVADGAGTTAMLPGGGFILLDTAVTPELAAEGLARDVVRAVQQARRAADLGVSDRISLTIAATPAAQQAIRAHQPLIARETLATAVELAEPAALDMDPLAGQPTQVGDGEPIRIRLTA
jgi:isoleucyl-tRNA synthetase